MVRRIQAGHLAHRGRSDSPKLVLGMPGTAVHLTPESLLGIHWNTQPCSRIVHGALALFDKVSEGSEHACAALSGRVERNGVRRTVGVDEPGRRMFCCSRGDDEDISGRSLLLQRW